MSVTGLPSFWSMMIWGLLATVAMTTILQGAQGMRLSRLSLPFLAGTFFTGNRRWAVIARENETALTNVFTGRPARGIMNRAMREIGPISDAAPDFPLAATASAPLRTKAEAAGRDDFTALWAGQAFRLEKEMSARDRTTMLARDAQKPLERGSGQG